MAAWRQLRVGSQVTLRIRSELFKRSAMVREKIRTSLYGSVYVSPRDVLARDV